MKTLQQRLNGPHPLRLNASILGILIAGWLAGTARPAMAHDGENEASLVMTGELTVVQVDDFENHRSEILYKIQDNGSGKTHRLHFDAKPSQELLSSATVVLRGHSNGKVYRVRQ